MASKSGIYVKMEGQVGFQCAPIGFGVINLGYYALQHVVTQSLYC